MPETHESYQEKLKRASKIDQFEVLQAQDFVGLHRQGYVSKPQNEYQRQLRRKNTNDTCHNHVTARWVDNPELNEKTGSYDNVTTERVCNIPIKKTIGDPTPDHRLLPEILRPWALSHPDSAASRNNSYPGRFGRLALDGHSPTVATNAAPSGSSNVSREESVDSLSSAY